MKLNGGRACESTPAGSGYLVVVLGDGSELDVVAEGFQVVDQAAPGGLGVVVAGEVVPAEVAVLGEVVQDVPADHDEGVGDGYGGLAAAFLAEPAVEATELGARVAAGLAGRPGAFGEDSADLLVALAGAAGLVLTGGSSLHRVDLDL